MLGVTIGLLWGYVRQLDRFFTELYNVIDNIPQIIYMTLIALMVGKSFTIMAVSLIAFGWLGMARNIRNLVMMYRDREYNLASRCLGTSTWNIVKNNILPYLVSIIVTSISRDLPSYISLEVFLAWLGIGVGESTPSLGKTISANRTYMTSTPYLFWIPVAVSAIITVSLYIAGQTLADAADPKTHR